ncbi:MAG TPA: PocR ligand-binding domain-containing protein [Magnetospirillum sp.]|jgi:PAS domain S-box-containing protein|nr:PocR ligand-binding domain-containing protein [Magnetospirillum sp.]
MAKRFSDLIDVDQFSSMMRSFFEATGLPYGLLDTDNNILCGIGWQDICVNFHRVNETCLRRCHESDCYIAHHLHERPYIGYRCRNGLMDYATPIIIDGEHVATLFLGQFLHEPPDLDFFRRQAAETGLDEQAYMAALAKVPIVPKERAESAMAFFAKMAQMLSSVGMTRLRHRETEAQLQELNQTFEHRIHAHSADLAASNHALVEEIEQEKLAEQQLRRERDFSHAVINSLPGIFYLLDDHGRFLMLNRNMEALLGYGANELEGLSALELFNGSDKDLIAERIAQVFAEGRGSAEAAIVTKDGRAIPHYFTGLRVTLDDKPYLVGLGLDIRERLAVAAALEEKAQALQRSNEDLEQFAYVASHDLREPLRMVTSYVSLLERRYAGQLDEDARAFISYAREGALRMDRLILDLLEYSRVGRRAEPPTLVSCNDVAAQAIANLTAAIQDAGADVQIIGDLPHVQGHGEELTRLFQNIIGNAIKYRHAERSPVVRVSCDKQRDDLVFSVSDNGIGIAAEYAERIFLIFQRLHTRDQYEGTGIGLAICRKIVERHGGRMWMDANAPVGTTFCFTLPGSRPKP